VYGHYNPNGNSNTERIRRSGKERIPLSSMIWDINPPHPSKSVSSIATGNTNAKMSLSNHPMAVYTSRSGGGNFFHHSGLTLDNHHGLPVPSNVPPHHRYSFGVFDPPSSSKIGKG